MRHRKGFNHLSRKAPHRKAMLANMAASLIKEKRITTTTAKAKALRGYIEPLITKSKDDTTHSRRVVFSYLQDKDAVSELFREVSPKVMERAGGYTRILKLDQNRLGDNAEMAMIELVDFNPNLITETKETGGTRRRRRGGGSKKKAEADVGAEHATEAKADSSTAEGDTSEVKAEAEAETETVENLEQESEEPKNQATPEKEAKKEKEESEEVKTEIPESSEKEPKAEATEEKPEEEAKKDDKEEDKKES